MSNGGIRKVAIRLSYGTLGVIRIRSYKHVYAKKNGAMINRFLSINDALKSPDCIDNMAGGYPLCARRIQTSRLCNLVHCAHASDVHFFPLWQQWNSFALFTGTPLLMK
jgi:hypothetical protein